MPNGCSFFSPHQRERLTQSLSGLSANGVGLRKGRTRLFPLNLETALFVHSDQDPILGRPRVVGLRAVNEAGERVDAAVWALDGDEEGVLDWQAFSERLLALWHQSIRKGRGPHLFYFGERVLKGLQEWGMRAGGIGSLGFLWESGRLHHTDLRRLVQEHFDFPAPGRPTLYALGRILGLVQGEEGEGTECVYRPESLFHDDPGPPRAWAPWEEPLRQEAVCHVEAFLDLECRIWNWVRERVESEFEQTVWRAGGGEPDSAAAAYLRFLEEERRLREADILELQEYSLPERVERFRAIGPLTFAGTSLDEEGRFLYTFKMEPSGKASKFREDDFLKLAPVGSRDLQAGFSVILARYPEPDDRLSVLSRQGPLPLGKRLAYSLEEDLTDWNHPKLVYAVQTILSGARPHPALKLLSGGWTMDRSPGKLIWAMRWLERFEPAASTLNEAQKAALALPFRKRLGLIEGPPGTGKTTLLAWILIALVLEAQDAGEGLRIVVSALTHQAIDGVLRKVVELVARHRIDTFSARVLKWGRWKAEEGVAGGLYPGGIGVQPLREREELLRSPCLILGSTGFGLHNLLFSEGSAEAFPRVFDWVVFDEASQVLVPQALLSLAAGKGRFLFLGDVKQLPPVVLGKDYGGPAHAAVGQSVLGLLLDRYTDAHRVRLNRTYRMNEELCAFPSAMWYDGELHAAPGNAHSRLELPPATPESPELPQQTSTAGLQDAILDPEKPVVLVLAEHRGCHQQSDLEADIVARLAWRLMVRHGLSPGRIALISPHRAQNNAIANRLRELSGAGPLTLPVIDTVERMQGAERDVIFHAFTTSDPDHIMSEFLNNPNRFNVAITRAGKKLVVVGSPAFFTAVPKTEEALRANRCFKEFLQYCRRKGSLFVWPEADETPA